MRHKTFSLKYHNQTAVLNLERKITNALNLDNVLELTETIKKIKNDSNIRSLVLCSSNDKFFSIGFDIPELIKLNEKDFRTFYTAFNQLSIVLFTLPKPAIAAITGHAIAGGCILALCCDYRFIAEGRKLMGLNEIKLGVPVPFPAQCILTDLVGSRIAREINESGEFYKPEELLKLGIVDQIFPLPQVMPASIKKAEKLGALPGGAFKRIKLNRVEAVKSHILEKLYEKENQFIKLWFSGAARGLLQEAVKTF